jgi:hypothetical protein
MLGLVVGDPMGLVLAGVKARLGHDSGARARVGTLRCTRLCSGWVMVVLTCVAVGHGGSWLSSIGTRCRDCARLKVGLWSFFLWFQKYWLKCWDGQWFHCLTMYLLSR